MHRPTFASFLSGGYAHVPRQPKSRPSSRPLPVKPAVAALLALFALLASLAGGGSGAGAVAPVAATCQTPFVVFTDPDNPGVISTRGSITTVRDSGILGTYGGDGRFSGYQISGTQLLIVNSSTNHARVRGSFTATSPDGESSFVLRYSGEVDLTTGVATGTFAVGNGTGAADGLRAAGRIEAQLIGPLTFSGADVGLC
jgi:hypothetical protein